MSEDPWIPLTPKERELAKTACTDLQREVLFGKDAGLGMRRIALMIGVSLSTARGHRDAGLDAIERAKRRQ